MDTRKIYSQAGNMQNDIAKLYLEYYFNIEEYLTSSKDYFNNILVNFNHQ